MNSYIDIERNENARKERRARYTYAVTESCALLVCALLNFFCKTFSLLKNETGAIVVKGVCTCVAAVLLFGTAAACESGAITLASALVRAVFICGASFVVFNLFGED